MSTVTLSRTINKIYNIVSILHGIFRPVSIYILHRVIEERYSCEGCKKLMKIYDELKYSIKGYSSIYLSWIQIVR